ncbi:DUF3883 domain-containing protein [Pseudomonas aeruginosa]|uniref:DUF3883 domain-containing protein n=1 Tax=Pseudomonas aeruginosa TaxID=287 RepID=UPI000FEDE496|nr:DUF3883 domain-containing protein [Pseudomonas aeruginosa]RPX26201.1 hypothetical protein IPC729_04605 [Pseudomonas aeruginosa]WCW85379.1 DUF3883 domain-containing protein [Pseudomonas aeruginosa]
MNKILWVKFGWSEYYRGGDIAGNFAWLNQNKGTENEGRGHEAYNFMPDVNGTYYCYVPPQGGNYAPYHDDPEGWTVVCLAKNPATPGIHVVGWYENATLHGEWIVRPNNTDPRQQIFPHPAYDWSYCITSNSAYFIPPEERTLPFSDPSVKQGKYSFLDGPDVTKTENKARVQARLESLMNRLASVAIHNPNEHSVFDPQLDQVDPLRGFGTPEHRKAVELAAEKAVIEYYIEQGYSSQRTTHLPCGYDFIFKRGESALHLEVKGTAGTTPRFFLTRNEHNAGLMLNPDWRLAMVTSALSDSPQVTVYNARQLKEAFNLDPYVYIGEFVPKPES